MPKVKKSAKAGKDATSEEYYQISEEIYASFSKFRPPVDLYQYREDIQTIYPFAREGQRLTEAEMAKAVELCQEGILFVAHSDWSKYAEHIVHQIDLLLLDSSFKPEEVGDVMVRALTLRYGNLFEQPVQAVYDKFYEDFMVFAQYIWDDKHRLRYFLRYIHTGDYTPANHAVNTLLLAAWMFTQTDESCTRRVFEKTLLGIYIHDIGMSKIPPHILSKAGKLKPDETDKMREHILTGTTMMGKLGVSYDETNLAIMDHHERLDGSGYPKKSKSPSTIGRLTAIGDSISAMIQKTSYSEAMPIAKAIEEIITSSSKYDANLSKKLQNALDFKLFDKAKATIPGTENLESDETSAE